MRANCIAIDGVPTLFFTKAVAEFSYGLSHVPSWVSACIVDQQCGTSWKTMTVVIEGLPVCGTVKP